MDELKGDNCYKVLDNDQLILFYFTASWCGPCQKIYPYLLEIIKQLDSKLFLGAALFGVGWGIYGYCPGPAIASIVYQSPITLLFIAFMMSGMLIADLVFKGLSK